MDTSKYLDIRIAPRAIFDSLPTRASHVRWQIPQPDGSWKPMTWTEFAAEIREIACFLRGRGLAAGDRVSIFAANRVEWMSAAMAIQAAAGVMVPVYPSTTTEGVGYVIDHSDSRVVFVDGKALVARLFESGATKNLDAIVVLDDGLDALAVLRELRAAGKDVPSDEATAKQLVRWSAARELGRAIDQKDSAAFERVMMGVSLEQPGVMLYTSGTSGLPKGVPLTHNNVGENGKDWLEVLGPLLDEGMTDVLWLPMSHIFGFGEACIGNTLGWTTYLSDPASVLTRIKEVKPSVFMSVPSVWEKLAMSAVGEPTVERKKQKLAEVTGGNFHFCLSGGAGLKREVKELFHEVGLLIIEGYGLTESSPTLTMNRPDSFRFDSVGKPFPSVTLKLAEDGEILAKGPNVFKGYHKDPQASADAFDEEGWLKTGDVGRFTEDGFLQIVDRKKDILVTAGGKNVPPANIEQRFADDPFIAHVVVYGDSKKYLTAGVWLNDVVVDAELRSRGATDAARDEARAKLVQERVDRVNAALASYESIKKFAIMGTPLTVEGGLLTPTLKIKRKKIYETFRDDFEALYGA